MHFYRIEWHRPNLAPLLLNETDTLAQAEAWRASWAPRSGRVTIREVTA